MWYENVKVFTSEFSIKKYCISHLVYILFVTNIVFDLLDSWIGAVIISVKKKWDFKIFGIRIRENMDKDLGLGKYIIIFYYIILQINKFISKNYMKYIWPRVNVFSIHHHIFFSIKIVLKY